MTHKISISLYYYKKLDVEKEKRQLDQFGRKYKLSEIATYISNLNYGSILFNCEFAYTTCFE